MSRATQGLCVLFCLVVGLSSATASGIKNEPLCAGDNALSIGEQFWRVWSDHYALSNINHGDAPYRTDLMGQLSQQDVLRVFNACQQAVSKLPDEDDNTAALSWIIEHEAQKITNPVLSLNFSTVYSWLDQYRVAVASQPWHTEHGQDVYPNHIKSLERYIASQQSVLVNAVRMQSMQSCEATRYHLSAIKHSLSDDRFYFTVLAPLHMPEEHHIQDVERAVGALQRYTAYLEYVYLPACRESISVYAWPNGQKAYQQALQYYTSTALTAESIHEIGLAETARLKQRVDEIRQQDDFNTMYPSGSAQELFALLRDHPSLGFDSAEDMLNQAGMWGQLIREQQRGGFSVSADFPVLKTVPVPEAIAANSAEAMYQTGSDGQYGTMYINTAYPDKSRRYALPSLVLHEGFPGHHYQVFAKFRDPSLSKVRQKYYFHAMGEGWALYTESLAPSLLQEVALSLPHPDLLEIGALSYDLLRAARLVVDTGLHAKGWSRQQAIDYIMENTAVSHVEAVNAVERFISLPAQATSYKIGQMAILSSKQTAERALGGTFDLRAFHDAVLHRTSLPLSQFERSMLTWIEKQRPQAAVESE